MDEPMNDEDQPRRDLDEVSIASDFSIIPESFTGQEDTDTRSMANTSGFLRSEELQPTLAAEHSYGKVLFHNIQATYTADSDIAVSYVLTSSVTPKSSDRVALYKVGFSVPQDYLSYQWAPTPTTDHTTNQLPLTVVFKASVLPKDAGEFFQFCYVTSEGHIVGVSTPFQLVQVGALGGSNLCGVDDGEDGMVVVCTNESVLLDKINNLSSTNEKLVKESREQQLLLEERKRELDEKLQQLNMCQHHLQALETKMKKETTEKCELMGRIGQVVEEKGHLEDRVKTLDRSLALATTMVEELEAQCHNNTAERKKMEEEMLGARKQREQLEQSLHKCQEELKVHTEALENTVDALKVAREERDTARKELEFWTNTASADQNEKESLALKFATVNEELITKLQELENNKKLVEELEAALADTVVDLNSTKLKLEEVEKSRDVLQEEKSVHEERETVISQDNSQLKGAIVQLKEKVMELETAQKQEGNLREAAETIASDLSSRLQAAKAEYHNLALINMKLVKKVKKLRQLLNPDEEAARQAVMTSSVSSQVSSWLLADGETEQSAEYPGAVEGAVADDDCAEVISASMIQSCSSVRTRTTCSSCSHTTQQLSEAVNRKMEDIVKELTMQINSLKTQLHAREAQPQTAESPPSGEVAETVEADHLPEAQQDHVEQQEQQQPTEEQSQQQQTDESEQQEAPEAEAAAEGGAGDQQVLYSNSFLPAQRTAPVFLPESDTQAAAAATTTGTAESNRIVADSVLPSAPSPTPSVYSYLPCTIAFTPSGMVSSTATSGTQLVVPQPHLPAPIQGSVTLPPPLQPETTPTAIQAAVMSQFSSQQQQQHHSSSQGHESDDDDFHSTSDSDDPISLNAAGEPSSNGSPLIECPLCHLSFQQGAIRLLEEHINSHLEHVCPICSMVFQRNSEKRFQDHVHAHFSDEENGDDGSAPDDPSGPWGGRETRGAQLLQID